MGTLTSEGRKKVLRNADQWHDLFTGDEEKPKWNKVVFFFFFFLIEQKPRLRQGSEEKVK